MVLILHVVVCFLLIILVLLQSGKEGMGVIFGGGSTSLFGSSGAGGVLVKLTTFVAVVFLVTSLGYNLLSSSHFKQDSSIMQLMESDPSAPPVTPVPATPAAPASPTGNATAQ